MGRKLCISIALTLLTGGAIAPAAEAKNGLNRLIAPPSACPGQTDGGASWATQKRAIRCLTNFARHRAGMARLVGARSLNRSALDKSTDILRCDSFSHTACGRDFSFWMRRARYLPAPCWRVGENLAWATGDGAGVRSIFRAWIHSPRHRANILGRYTEIGIGLRVGDLDGNPGVHVLTQHFGSHCGPAAKPASHRVGLSGASAVAPAG